MVFQVRIEPSGHRFAVEEGETVLEAALRQGFALSYSCRNGACGSCKVRLLAGEVEHGRYEPLALEEAQRRAGWVLLCQARARTDLVIEAKEIGTVAGMVIKTLPGRVVRMERAAHDVMILHVKLPQSERLQYLPGQYLDILLRDGSRRSYSIANAPHTAETLELHVRHLPGGVFSGQVFTMMKEKDLLRLRGPLGTFFLREESERPVILVAGGTGFAPIKAILEHAFAKGVTRNLHLYWGVRARRDLYLPALATSWAERYPNFRYTPVLSDPLPEDDWRGRIGLVHEAVLQDYPDLGEYEVYASGPPPMIEAIKRTFPSRGLAEERLYYDAFEPAAQAT